MGRTIRICETRVKLHNSSGKQRWGGLPSGGQGLSLPPIVSVTGDPRVTPIFRPVILAAASAFFSFAPLAAPLGAETLAGSYLAATQADYNNDYVAAALYYGRALADDPENLSLLQSTLLAYLGEGDMKQALSIAGRMQKLNSKSQLAQLLVLADDIRKGDFAAANGIFKGGAQFSPLLDGLVEGWVDVGMGRMTDALAQFDLTAKNPAMKVFSQYHKALALALAGDFEAAETIFKGKNGLPIRVGRDSLIAQIEILSQLDRRDQALAVIKAAMNDSGDPELTALKARLLKGETLPFNIVANAKDGVSQVFVTLASVLTGQSNDRFGLIYGRIAEFLRPNSAAAILVVADLLDGQDQYKLAIKEFDKVPATSPSYYQAEIGRASALDASGKPDAGIRVLQKLAKTYTEIPTIFTALGDALRGQSRFAAATIAYDRAIKLLPEAKPSQWFLYYARGITYEREGNWKKAEADLRFALKLSPNQPLVLNYLGYGMVEKGINVKEAEKMIETAAKQKPNDGYITDSLGWVFYTLGKYKQAVPPLERAVQLMPVDPIINDHLGDAYWMVGRKLEARFQWTRALSFNPDKKEAARIRQKLKLGLNEVRTREAKTDGKND